MNNVEHNMIVLGGKKEKKISSDSLITVLPQILPKKLKLKEFSYKKTRL